MRKFIILLLALCILLCGCSKPASHISEEKAIKLAFDEAVKYADGPITEDMGVCKMVEGRYEITFDAQTDSTQEISVIIIVIMDPASGEILEIMEAA